MKIYNIAFLLFFLSVSFDQAIKFPQSSPLTSHQQTQKTKNAEAVKMCNAVAANIIFKSADGGLSWQDISEGLPVNFQANNLPGEGFLANESGVYISAGNELYHSKLDVAAPFWKQQTTSDKHSSFATGNTGVFTYNRDRQSLQKLKGTNGWSPVYKIFSLKTIRGVFETVAGTIIISSNYRSFRSTNNGKTWSQHNTGGWSRKIAESDGVLLATSQSGILRSTNDGENWEQVLYEGGVGIDVVRIKGGFAAITYNTESETRRVRTSYDGGKTWQAIDGGLPGDQRTASIIEVGENFFCGHPDGIYKSSDKGKTWKLLFPSKGDKVFNLFVSGNVIYAIPRSGGC